MGVTNVKHANLSSVRCRIIVLTAHISRLIYVNLSFVFSKFSSFTHFSLLAYAKSSSCLCKGIVPSRQTIDAIDKIECIHN